MSLPDFSRERARMVAEQIARRGVRSPLVLEAMAAVPRERFVPASQREEAYADRPLPIGQGQTISQPYIVAAMIEALELDEDARVLDVGAGSGYTTAVLAKIAKRVVGIERHAALAAEANARLEALGMRNATIVVGDGTLGHALDAPYDAILVSAAAPRVPEALVEQLAPGGRLVVPVGDREGQEVVRVRRAKNGMLIEEPLVAVRFVPLVGEAGFPPER